MGYYVLKVAITAILVVAISEIAKRSTLLAGVLASIPLLSVLAMTWLYLDTRDVSRVSHLATSVFWLVIPSLALFITLPILLKKGLGFFASLGLSSLITIACYYVMIAILARFDVRL